MEQLFTATTQLRSVYASGYPAALTIANKDTAVTAYLTSSIGTAPGTGFALEAGNVINWDAGRELYVSTAAGTALLSIVENSGFVFPTQSLAVALLVGGLPSAIAAALNALGAPPTNVFDQFATLQFSSTGANFTSIIYDVAKYQSVNYFLGDAAGAFAAPLPRRVDFQWLDSTGTIPLWVDTVYVTDTNNNVSGTVVVNSQGSMPTRSGKLRVIMYATARTGTTNQIFLVGSYRTLTSLTHRMISGYFGGSGAVVAGVVGERFASMNFGAVPAATVLNEYPPQLSGPAQLSYRVVLTAGGVALTLFVLDLLTGLPLETVLCPAGAITQNVVGLIIPNRPIQIQASAGAAVVVTECKAVLTYQT